MVDFCEKSFRFLHSAFLGAGGIFVVFFVSVSGATEFSHFHVFRVFFIASTFTHKSVLRRRARKSNV